MSEKTHAEIIAEMRKTKYGDEECNVKWCLTPWADRLDAAHKREVDALNQRCAELDAEVAAKDEVIKRLNDAIAEEQRRKMAAAEKSSVACDCAKLREALGKLRAELWNNTVIAGKRKFELYEIADSALAAPPRNCDKYPTFNDAIRALADKRGWHDEKWDSERYCILASWLFAPATEQEGGNDANK